jgi:hypothetical protein
MAHGLLDHVYAERRAGRPERSMTDGPIFMLLHAREVDPDVVRDIETLVRECSALQREISGSCVTSPITWPPPLVERMWPLATVRKRLQFLRKWLTEFRDDPSAVRLCVTHVTSEFDDAIFDFSSRENLGRPPGSTHCIDKPPSTPRTPCPEEWQICLLGKLLRTPLW